MPLLSSTQQKSKRITVTISLNENLLNEVKAYCQWAGIDRYGEFFTQSVDYILKNDKEWRKIYSLQHQKNSDVTPSDDGR